MLLLLFVLLLWLVCDYSLRFLPSQLCRSKTVMVDELNADIDRLNASIISLGEDQRRDGRDMTDVCCADGGRMRVTWRNLKNQEAKWWSTWWFRDLWHEEWESHQLQTLNHSRGLLHRDGFRLIPIEVNVRRNVLYCDLTDVCMGHLRWDTRLVRGWASLEIGLSHIGFYATSSGKIMTLTMEWGIPFPRCGHTKIVWLPAHIPLGIISYPPLSGVGECPFLGILNITLKHLLEITSQFLGGV